jgi:hypothetical protein
MGLRKQSLVASRRSGTMVFYRLDLEIWKEWGQATETGQADWALFRRMVRRVPACGREGGELHAEA